MFFRREDLPLRCREPGTARDQLLMRVIGSPDPYANQIDGMGGMVTAIEQGFPQRAIQDAAYQTQLAQEREEKIVVGVNRFSIEENADPDVRPRHIIGHG